MKLYEIANEYQSLLSEIDEAGMTDELKAKLESITIKGDEKIKNVACMIKTLEKEREIIEEEKKRLCNKMKSHDDQIEWLRNYLTDEMQRMDVSKLENKPYFNVYLRDGRYKVNSLDENLIPEDYKDAKIIVTLNKTKICNEILAGVVIPGAELIQRKYVEIR